MPLLTNGKIQIYYFNFENYRINISRCRDVLNDNERILADKIKNHNQYIKFVFCRAFAKTILAQKLNIKAKDIFFKYNEYGKPSIDNYPINFNITHSEFLVAIGISRELEIGLDMDYVKNNDESSHYNCHVLNPFNKSFAIKIEPASLIINWLKLESLCKCIGNGVLNFLSNISEFNIINDELLQSRILFKGKEYNIKVYKVKDSFLIAYCIEKIPRNEVCDMKEIFFPQLFI